jgi:hypothetical protein
MQNTTQKTTWITKNKVNLGVAIGILVAIGAGLVGYKSFNSGRYPDIPDQNLNKSQKIPTEIGGLPTPTNEPIPGLSSDKPAYISKIRILKEKVAKESSTGELDMNTIVLIHEALMDITEDSFG